MRREKKGIGWTLIFAVLLAVLAFVSDGCAANTYTVCPGGGCNYTGIQAAVNAASDGDTIIVCDGVYTENINVNSRLTIQSENGSSKTVVDAHTGNHGFAVLADWVNISGFTVTNASSNGIYLNSVNHCNISYNILLSNGNNGISMQDCSQNSIDNNIANSNAQQGMGLRNSNYNNITNNSANLNGIAGISLVASTKNTLINNSFSNNELGISIPPMFPLIKIYFDHSIDSSNKVNGKPVYTYFNQSDILIDGLDTSRLAIWFCTNFTVTNVTVSGGDGINLKGSSNNTFKACISINNTFGIHVDSSNSNNITHTNISNNLIGILMSHSSGNNISNCWLNSNNASGTNLNGFLTLLDGSGIIIANSTYNRVFNNNASYNHGYGIVLRDYSNNNTISYNNASSNGYTGMKLDYSIYNNLSNNTVSTNGQHGIWLRISPQNILRRNVMDHNGKFNLILAESPDLEWWNNDIDTSNTVNGLPVYYIYNKSDLIIDNYATKKLSIVGCENVTVKNINYSDGDPITLSFTNNSCVEDCTVSNNNACSFFLVWSHNNTLANNRALNNEGNGIFLQADSSHNNIHYNIITGNGLRGIELQPPTSNNCIYDNYFGNSINAYDEGNNIWNITKTYGTNIIGNHNLGGNFWNDYAGEDTNGDGLGDTPYDIPGGTNKDYLPLVAPNIFDTTKGDYPSISGTHNGTIKLKHTITVSKLYTYPCSGTGGHTEHIKIWNATWLGVEAYWDGYQGDWSNISLQEFTLVAGETYNYTIRTGSYPQIIHEHEYNATGGVITCTEFVDVNGKRHEGWIPAIRLY